MIREFFLSGSVLSVWFAWTGLFVVVGYAVFSAMVNYQINQFYASFYDLLQTSSSVLAEYDLQGNDTEVSSGSFESDRVELAPFQDQVTAELWRFFTIVLPVMIISPISRWVRSLWSFQWRMRMMKCYLVSWDVNAPPIEGAAQRIHEDTYRFSRGIEACIATVLDALATLMVFTPLLFDLSTRVAPPFEIGMLRTGWLFTTAMSCAFYGLSGAMFTGQRLVSLEIANQRVEAALRRDLVLLESDPGTICGNHPDISPEHNGTQADTSQSSRYGRVLNPPLLYFKLVLSRLFSNYYKLFLHFGFLNAWLSSFDQLVVLIPYVLAAPLIFASDPDRRITLGTLIQVSNCFGKIFDSLSVIANNWGAVNDFRSVLVRLRQYESKVYEGRNVASTCWLPTADADNHDFEHTLRRPGGMATVRVHTHGELGAGGVATRADSGDDEDQSMAEIVPVDPLDPEEEPPSRTGPHGVELRDMRI